MDRWSGKRAIEAQPDFKKGVGVVSRDKFNNNVCSDEKKSMKFTRFVGSSGEKDKSVLSSPNGKEVTGTSSKICGSSSSSVKTEKQPLSQISMESSESSRASEDELETEANSSNLQSSSRIKRGFRQRFWSSKHEFHPGPSCQSTSANRGCSQLLSGVIPSSSSSSARGKNITELPAEERRLGFNPRGSVSDSRRGRHCILNDDNDVASVGSQRSINRGSSRIRHGLSSITTTNMSQTETSNNPNSPVSLELFSGFQELGLSSSLSSQDSFHSYNLDGISEIQNLIRSIEQDIELNYEIMETGLLLGGLSFYDRHRDLRLDIDNMSYEELLALEERIGTVSTALTEEAISKCLKTSIYKMKPTSSPCDHKEDTKCSICQEEYTLGDEVGRLHCGHKYHLKCVQEWLRMKSWCPICKATAETSSSK